MMQNDDVPAAANHRAANDDVPVAANPVNHK
jgi:hypothetical protein